MPACVDTTDGRGLKVLFVCLGNICRSPTAEAVLRKLAAAEAPELDIQVDSAGTSNYHPGAAPDSRSQAAARRRGYDLSSLRARQVRAGDFHDFELILAMDHDNLADLDRLAPASGRGKLALFMQFAPGARALEVPDPYEGGPEGFEQVLDMIEAASRGLLQQLKARKPAA